jgi:MFS family permease
MFAVSLSLIAMEFESGRERGTAMGIYGATIGAAVAVGPLVGGALVDGLGWRSIFFLNVPIGAASVAITYLRVRESRDPNATRVDWAGLATFSSALFLLVLALLRGNELGWTSDAILAELGGAVAALVAFVIIESRVREPMLPLKFFRNPSFTGVQIAAFSISASFFAVFLYTTLYLQQVLGLSAIEAGLVYLPGTLAMLVVSGATAQLGAKVPARTMIGIGLAMVGAGMMLFTLADVTSHWWIVLPGEMVALIGTGLFNPAVTNVALSSAPVEQSGVAAGVHDTFRQAGIAVGVAALGALIPAENALGGGSPQAYVDGLHDALWAGAGLAVVGAIAATLLISKKYGAAAELPAEEPSQLSLIGGPFPEPA